jgi:fatty-acid desaturase
MLAGFWIFIVCGSGVTIGAHRYFTHRSFKAKFGLRCLLAACFTLAGEVRAVIILGWVLIVIQMSWPQTCLLLTTQR